AVTDTVGGNITLTASGTATTDDLTINASVTASGGNGTIQLSAGDGVSVTGAVSAAGTGTITVTADSDVNGAGDFSSSGSGTLTTNNANITINANDVAIGAGISASGNTVFLKPSAAQTVGLGGAAGTFNVSDAEADLVTATTLEIGKATGAAIKVDDVSPG